MRFRRIVAKSFDPFEDVVWTKRTSEIRGPDGSVIFRMKGVEVPDSWSQTATDVLAQKYFRKAGVPAFTRRVPEEGVPVWLQRSEADPDRLADLPPEERFGSETSLRQVAHRLAGAWTYWGWKLGYFDSEEDARAFYCDAAACIVGQLAVPNSPQWFSTGLHWAYGIDGPPQGHWYPDAETGEIRRATSAYERPQPHACFIQSVRDDLVNPGGIMDLWVREARLFKYGSGTGSNFSEVRAEGEPLSGGGHSSGLMSFLRVGDAAAGAIKSGGTTRRAAKMVILDADHPDILEFVEWKAREERKVAAMVAGSHVLRRHADAIFEAVREDGTDPRTNARLREAVAAARRDGVPDGWLDRVVRLAAEGHREDVPELDTDWQGEAYRTVSGQNSNNSVSIPDAFLDAVDAGRPWPLVRRTDGGVAAEVDAREVWERICLSAWVCADPGVQFRDTMNAWHKVPAEGPIRATNPCSEFVFVDDTACNLASINFLPFLREDGSFDIETFRHVVRLYTTILEISVAFASYPSEAIARNSWRLRPLGLGFANLGGLLMASGIPYDSEEGRGIAAALTALMSGTAWATSAEIARECGPFAAWADNREHVLRVLRNHRRAAHGEREGYEGLDVPPVPLDSSDVVFPLLAEAARDAWDEALEKAEAWGVRNAQTTVIAPTGTIGLVMDCDTTGIEPDFALVKFKKLAGGGLFRIVNRLVPRALAMLGYDEDRIRRIVAWIVGTRTIRDSAAVDPERLESAGDEAVTAFDSAISRGLGIEEALVEFAKAAGIDGRKAEDVAAALGTDTDTLRRSIEGTGTVEGCPLLYPHHLPVFDCAVPSGGGSRYLRPEAHVLMMAAVQPFVCGAISKTVNLPREATVADVDRIYRMAHSHGLKAIAVYRDGSKLSQPLSVSFDENPQEESREKPEGRDESPAANPDTPVRRRLPERRRGYTQRMVLGGHKLYLRTGEYENGTLGEIFIDMHKEGAAFRSLMNGFAMVVSIALQYGVPLDELVDAFVHTRFEPSGPVFGHPNVRMASSILDLVFRDLAISYLGRWDLAHVKPTESDIEGNGSTGSAEATHRAPEEPRGVGYTGDPCPSCGNFTMVRSGTCQRCVTCGSTTGCS